MIISPAATASDAQNHDRRELKMRISGTFPTGVAASAATLAA